MLLILLLELGPTRLPVGASPRPTSPLGPGSSYVRHSELDQLSVPAKTESHLVVGEEQAGCQLPVSSSSTFRTDLTAKWVLFQCTHTVLPRYCPIILEKLHNNLPSIPLTVTRLIIHMGSNDVAQFPSELVKMNSESSLISWNNVESLFLFRGLFPSSSVVTWGSVKFISSSHGRLKYDSRQHSTSCEIC